MGPAACASASLLANPIGNGLVQFQIVLTSSIGPMAGSAQVTWGGVGNSGVVKFDVIGTSYVSPIETVGGVPAGTAMGLTLSLDAISVGGPPGPDCGMAPPAVVVPVA